MISSKVYFQTDEDNPNSGGLTWKAIDQELAASLDRLGQDTVDLYQIHRWDDDTPISESLRSLDVAVHLGDIRYIGASSMWGHQFGGALHASDHPRTEPVCYNAKSVQPGLSRGRA